MDNVQLPWVFAAPSPSSENDESRPREPEPTESSLHDRIRSLNPSAKPEFLLRFSRRDLAAYLAHLESLAIPRGRTAVWRPADGESAISSARVG